MKKAVNKTSSDQQAFVVTAVFVKQMTVKAGSETQALRIAEDGTFLATSDYATLSNWHAHKV